MTQERIIEIIQTEKECVLRQDTDKCDRNCGKCDLVLPTEEVLQAYDAVIKSVENHDVFMKYSYSQGKQDALEQRSIIKELIEDMREVTPEESKSIDEYLSRTSKKTGVNIFDLDDVEDEIDFVQEHKKIPVTLNLEPCEDAVSREAALKEAYSIVIDGEKFDVVQVETLLGLPSVTVRQTDSHLLDGIHAMGYREGYKDAQANFERQTGKWIYIGNRDIWHPLKIVECNKCHNRAYGSTDFCPNCGKRMESEQNE